MSVKGRFLSDLVMKDLGDGEHFELYFPLEYVSIAGVHYVVPTGFVTDLNSSPRFMWRLYAKSNKANRAAVLHDFLYATAIVPKDTADHLYREASEACGVHAVVRWCAFQAVHRFGKGAWQQHAEDRVFNDNDDAA